MTEGQVFVNVAVWASLDGDLNPDTMSEPLMTYVVMDAELTPETVKAVMPILAREAAQNVAKLIVDNLPERIARLSDLDPSRRGTP